MFCAACQTQIEDGDRFCKQCGNALQEPRQVAQRPYSAGGRQPGRQLRPQGQQAHNPYRDQIAQLRLQLKEARMNLRDLNANILNTRSNYFEIDSFAQRGIVHNVGRMIEGAQLFSPYQQRKQLQDQVAQIERQLLPLEKAQEQWRMEQQHLQENTL